VNVAGAVGPASRGSAIAPGTAGGPPAAGYDRRGAWASAQSQRAGRGKRALPSL